MTKADKAERDAIRARCEAATPGPWGVTKRGRFSDHDECYVDIGIWAVRMDDYEDADFIANARQDVPALLAASVEADDAIAENERWNDTDCNTCLINGWSACEEICESKASLIACLSDISTDRNRWKAHAEALGRALLVEATCMTCVHIGADIKDKPCNDCYGGDGSLWQFDEARFTTKTSHDDEMEGYK